MPILLFVLQFVFRLIILIFGKIKEKISSHHHFPLSLSFFIFLERQMAWYTIGSGRSDKSVRSEIEKCPKTEGIGRCALLRTLVCIDYCV